MTGVQTCALRSANLRIAVLAADQMKPHSGQRGLEHRSETVKGTRIAASPCLNLPCVNIIAVISYWHVLKDLDAALAQHLFWGTLLLVTLLHGPGRIALDSFVWPRSMRV